MSYCAYCDCVRLLSAEDPYDAAERFIEEQKVKDSGLLDNTLVSHLVEYILACTEAGDEPAYPGAAAAPRITASTSVPVASAPAKQPTKEELEAREKQRLQRERELRAEKDKAEAQKLEVKRRMFHFFSCCSRAHAG